MPADYIHTDDDLQIANGDFVVGESSLQHQSLLMRMQKGELRQYPKTCVGFDDYLLEEGASDIRQEIQKQFEADGLTVRSIAFEVSTDGLKLIPKVEAFYP